MPGKKTALICGISGQDGSYLARFLLAKGYEIYGTSRNAGQISHNLKSLGVAGKVKVITADLSDYGQVRQIIETISVDEIYNLAGQSSVGLSFVEPRETFESIAVVTLNLLEAARVTSMKTRLFIAGSGECFGDTSGALAGEKRVFQPKNPYGSAKAAAFWEVAGYRAAYNSFACTGILFNHESPLRPPPFVTRKITTAASRIAAGKKESLTLGDISIRRDWGWAPEYVEAMWLMLQRDKPDDYILCTGELHSLEEFVRVAFEVVGLNWHDHVVVDQKLFRPTDLPQNYGDPTKAKVELGWSARSKMPDVVKMMMKQPDQRAA